MSFPALEGGLLGWPSHGGWGGIRTHGGREPTPVFKTGALNRSATHPKDAVAPYCNICRGLAIVDG